MVRRPGFISRWKAPVRRAGSRASQFYGRTARAVRKYSPYVAPMIATATKAKPEIQRGIRFLMDLRRRRGSTNTFRNAQPSTAMEYVRPVGDGNSVSYFNRKGMRIRGFKKRMMRAAPMHIRKQEIVSSNTWAYGRQSTTVFLHNTNTDLNTTTTPVVISGNPTAKILIQSMKLHWLITSGAKAGIKMRIYEGCYKRGTTSAFNPLVLWANGLADTGTTELNVNIDSKPFSSPSFNAACHITKVTNVYLAQGRTHEHYANYGYNKLYDREYFNAGANEYLQGWTRFTMFTCYGEPVADVDADVTTAGGRILIVGTKTTRFKYNVPQNYVSAFTQSIPNVGISSERLFDEGSGEIEVNTVL